MSTPLRVLYGGSFDPVHNGHLAIARAARDALRAEVSLLPAGDPPHKADTHANAEQRAMLLDLAVAGEAGLRVDRRELRRAGPSYTVETLLELRAELGPQVPLAWLIGADSLLQLHTWHRWRELFALAHLVVVQRPETSLDAQHLRDAAPEVLAEISPRGLPAGALAGRPQGGFTVLPLPGLRPESSTELRRRIAAGEPWQDWVSEPVAACIARLNLYRVPAVIMAASPTSASP